MDGGRSTHKAAKRFDIGVATAVRWYRVWRDHGERVARKQGREDVKAAREAWFEGQFELDPEKLVFIDETGAKTNMARIRGRAKRGERCRAGVPHGHWNTTTFTELLDRFDGIAAPMLLPGSMDGDAFRAYVEKVPVPELKPGDTVIMDNLPAHKVAGIREMIKGVGASLLYLPPYSLDFNSIELVFSRLKSLLHKAAARTKKEQDEAIADAIERYPAEQCANYFKACGYDPE